MSVTITDPLIDYMSVIKIPEAMSPMLGILLNNCKNCLEVIASPCQCQGVMLLSWILTSPAHGVMLLSWILTSPGSIHSIIFSMYFVVMIPFHRSAHLLLRDYFINIVTILSVHDFSNYQYYRFINLSLSRLRMSFS